MALLRVSAREKPGKRVGGLTRIRGFSLVLIKTPTKYNFTEFFWPRQTAIVVCEGFRSTFANFWRHVVCEGFQWAEKKFLMKYWEKFSDFLARTVV